MSALWECNGYALVANGTTDGKPALRKRKSRLATDLAAAPAIGLWQGMATYPPGTIAVIFIAQRTAQDDAGYAKAAADMESLAAQQAGYRGFDSVRGADGLGITISYWADDDAAKAWRDNPKHTAIRDMGRGRWYHHYDLHVAAITRSYDWVHNDDVKNDCAADA